MRCPEQEPKSAQETDYISRISAASNRHTNGRQLRVRIIHPPLSRPAATVVSAAVAWSCLGLGLFSCPCLLWSVAGVVLEGRLPF